MTYNIREIIKGIDEMGGTVFTDQYLLNIAAFRDLSNPDSWNDVLVYFYWDKNNDLEVSVVEGFTTDPGIQYLKNPVDSRGTAILCEGWHRRLWKLGLHKGYEALQQYSSCKVYRDNNRNEVFDLNPSKITDGVFGINLHRANVNSLAKVVGPQSAGCLVIRDIRDYNKFMDAVHTCYNHGQRYFSLALFEKD